MTAPAAFFAVSDLVDALGEETYMALFDDARTRSRVAVDASGPVALVVKRAHAMTRSFLPGPFGSATFADTTDPASMSELLRHAALSFAECFAYRRKPEWAKSYGAFPGGALWTEALALAKRIQEGTQQIATDDNAPRVATNQGGVYAEEGPKTTIESTGDNTALGDW